MKVSKEYVHTVSVYTYHSYQYVHRFPHTSVHTYISVCLHVIWAHVISHHPPFYCWCCFFMLSQPKWHPGPWQKAFCILQACCYGNLDQSEAPMHTILCLSELQCARTSVLSVWWVCLLKQTLIHAAMWSMDSMMPSGLVQPQGFRQRPGRERKSLGRTVRNVTNRCHSWKETGPGFLLSHISIKFKSTVCYKVVTK